MPRQFPAGRGSPASVHGVKPVLNFCSVEESAAQFPCYQTLKWARQVVGLPNAVDVLLQPRHCLRAFGLAISACSRVFCAGDRLRRSHDTLRPMPVNGANAASAAMATMSV